MPASIQLPLTLYSVFTLGFTLTLAFDRKKRFKSIALFLIMLQFIFELYLEAAIISTTGNLSSPFSTLFLLTIISAALIFRLIGTLTLASLVSFVFTVVVWINTDLAQGAESLFPSYKSIYLTQDTLFYPIFFHILMFYFVAFISGYLAERLRERDLQLENTSEELKKAKLETDDILLHLNSGLITIDSAGKVVYFNKSAERILDYREEEVRGLDFQDAFSNRTPEFVNTINDSLVTRFEHPRKEISVIDKNNISKPVGLSTSILTHNNNELRGVIAIFSDLTEVKLMEAKVRSADRLAAIGELSASIAHEIRNPLAAISGSVELLKSDLKLNGDNEKLMNLIIKESDRLAEILTEFLTYAKIDRPSYNKIELNHLITEVVDVLLMHPSYKNTMQVKVESQSSLVYVIGDEGLLKQVLLNLLVNACEAFENQSGEIIVSVNDNMESDEVELIIADNGPGIDMEIQNKIFAPFYSTKKEGTGLGLAIVDRVCTTLRIPITVDSSPEKGTAFNLKFKAYQPVESTATTAV